MNQGYAVEHLLSLKNGSWVIAFEANSVENLPFRFVILDSCLNILNSVKLNHKELDVQHYFINADEESNVYFVMSIKKRLLDTTIYYSVISKFGPGGENKWSKLLKYESDDSQLDGWSGKQLIALSDGLLYSFSIRSGYSGSKLVTNIFVNVFDTSGNHVRQQRIPISGLNNFPLGLTVFEGSVHLFFKCAWCQNGLLGILTIYPNGKLSAKYVRAEQLLDGIGEVASDKFGNTYYVDIKSSHNESVLFSLDKKLNMRWGYVLSKNHDMRDVQLISKDSSILLGSIITPNAGQINYNYEVSELNLDGKPINTKNWIMDRRISPIISISSRGDLGWLRYPNTFMVNPERLPETCFPIPSKSLYSLEKDTTIKIVDIQPPPIYRIQPDIIDTVLPFKTGWFSYTFNCNTGLFGSNMQTDTLLCYGNNLKLQPNVFGDTVGLKYRWNTGDTTPYLTTSKTGKYQLSITNGSCAHKHKTTVLVADELRATIPDSVGFCPNDSMAFLADTLFNETTFWQKPDSSFTNSVNTYFNQKGVYKLNSHKQHCSQIDSTNSRELSNQLVGIVADTLVCYQQATTLLAKGAKKTNWQPTALFASGEDTLQTTTIYPKQNVTVFLNALNSNGCLEQDSIEITVLPELEVTISPKDTSVCRGDSVVFTSQLKGGKPANYKLKWFGNNSDSSQIKMRFRTTKNVIVELNDNCSETKYDTAVVTVKEVELGNIEYSPIAAKAGHTISFNNTIANDSSKWFVNDTIFTDVATGQHYFTNPGEYTIRQIVFQNGCADTAYLKLTVDDDFGYYYPTAFTPDNDGLNDYWFIKGHGIAEVELSIFNRWGAPIFWYQDEQVKWDGTFKEKPCPPGRYQFVAFLTDLTGAKHQVRGEFVLLR
ncbi:MAG: gliding motility-associated C-terminal domain-containing protein [Bacteroidetes bacterium]|nr:gliding motility-associated C-terminal domain-containing protein [Bacteroidota bacterium]